ncbi:potassium channel subfamily K member 18 [Platysternon megacephalum]|uniref:Potassium channel subfamily K member 18 n=1 Tax=Platysternon megacephalum TaxID=55544 RepID=A0A4D9EIR2_9SAUR|nr:potassium channel subfamily K member 18 [Platysternon megacephalum]
MVPLSTQTHRQAQPTLSSGPAVPRAGWFPGLPSIDSGFNHPETQEFSAGTEPASHRLFPWIFSCAGSRLMREPAELHSVQQTDTTGKRFLSGYSQSSLYS